MVARKQLKGWQLVRFKTFLEVFNMWTKPEYTEMRFGFEVTMYIANR
jgi:coenzyme PQQ precursor peptide PqqA